MTTNQTGSRPRIADGTTVDSISTATNGFDPDSAREKGMRFRVLKILIGCLCCGILFVNIGTTLLSNHDVDASLRRVHAVILERKGDLASRMSLINLENHSISTKQHRNRIESRNNRRRRKVAAPIRSTLVREETALKRDRLDYTMLYFQQMHLLYQEDKDADEQTALRQCYSLLVTANTKFQLQGNLTVEKADYFRFADASPTCSQGQVFIDPYFTSAARHFGWIT
jgi:hypothetical protein